MLKKLRVLTLTGYLTDYLPSTQKSWKVLTMKDIGCKEKELEKLLKSGEPFMCHGKISHTVNHGEVLLTSSIKKDNGVYVFTLSGAYTPSGNTTITDVSAIFSYDPVLKILKGRRP